MFTIDFTKPWLYKDIIYFNQGNLSTNNTLRCKLITGGSDDFTGGSIACTFTTKDSIEISGFGKLVDAKNGIIDIVFPSNALVVGTNKLEVLVNRADGGVAQSPPVMYDIWQGLTTGNGIEAETNYPILIELINSVNEASNKANLALNKANSMITDMTDAIDNAYRSASEADIATSNANSKITELDDAKTEMITKVDASIDTMKTDVNKAKEDMKLTTDAKVKEIDTAITNMNASVEDAKTDMQATTDAKMQQVDNSIVAMKSEVETAKNEMASKANEKIADVDRALAAGTKDLEVKESRRDMDGVEHDTLKLRLESDLKKGKVIEETKEGNYISFDETVKALINSIELHGDTVQHPTNLANIRSSCIPNGDGTFKMSILSIGENLFNGVLEQGYFNTDGSITSSGYSEFARSADFIKIDGFSNLIVSTTIPNNLINIFCYGGGKVFISKINNGGAIPNGTRYVKFSIRSTTSPIVINGNKTKLELGTVATPYTPYEETRCDIKLPCQLEKWDRLYFDKVENAWCIDKYTNKFKYSNERIVKGADKSPQGFTPFLITNNFGVQTITELICNKYTPNGWASTYPCAYLQVTEAVVLTTITDLAEFTSHIQGLEILYKASIPQKIVLPQSEQIKLNSFANKTHIYAISGEVDATVKATVSKSLASTVQANANEINILNGKIDDIQGLKESQDFAYETDKGYLVCKDTQNGVVKDLKVYGKSLVNDGGAVNKEFTQFSVILNSKKMLTPNKEYTLIIENKTNTDLIVYTAEEAIVPTQNINLKANSTTMKKIVSQSTVNSLRLLKSNTPNSNLFNLNVLLLEGDHTQNPPQYFEGIASVGNGNEIEVLSVNNGNLLKNIPLKTGYVKWNTGAVVENSEYKHTDFINILPNTKIYFKGANKNMCFYDENKVFIPMPLSGGEDNNYTNISPKNAKYIKCSFDSLDNPNNAYIGYFDTLNNNEPKQDKKTILFKDTDNTWKPVTELNEFDGIDSTTNILYKNSLRTVITGNEQGLSMSSPSSLTNVLRFLIKIPNLDSNSTEIFCNMLKYKDGYNLDEEHCYVFGDTLYFFLSKTRFTNHTVEGLKTYLSTNPLEVVVKVKGETYEINPLFPNSFDNGTMISFGSGAIAPHASWKITSSLPNFVKELSNQIKQLQDKVYKTNVANFTVALNTLDTKLRLDRLEAPQM